MYIAAAMTSILFACSDAISVLKVMGLTSAVNPWSLPISLMISTMIPEIWLVLVSRNVKGMPVGVDPTRTTCWASLAPNQPNARAVATTTRQSNLTIMAGNPPEGDGVKYESAWKRRLGTIVPSPDRLGTIIGSAWDAVKRERPAIF